VLDENINIRSIYEDREHNIWIATDSIGVLRLNHRWYQTTIKRPFSVANKMDIESVVHKSGNFEDNLWLYDSQQHVLTLNRYKMVGSIR